MANPIPLPSSPQIVITGGPGGGKTTFLRWLQTEAPDCQRFLAVPEAATRLIQSGMRPGVPAFQEEVIALQLATEWVCRTEAAPDQILVCDRGTLDGLAYWRLLGLPDQAFFEMSGMALEEHLGRYSGVIHLETAAIGALAHYQRIEMGRPEPPEEALRIDQSLSEIWSAHPRFCLIENGPGGWMEKRGRTLASLLAILHEGDRSRSPSA